MVYVALPSIGTQVRALQKCGEIESVKAVSDLYSPVSGEVIERNDSLIDQPELVNTSPYGEGWLLKVRLSSDSGLGALLGAAEYREMVSRAEEH